MSWWTDRPLGVKLSALVGAGSLALGVFGVIAVTALQDTGERTDELLRTTTATGAALEADMMHDAVRADVLQALLSGAGSQYDSAVSDLRDHAATLQESLAAVRDAGLGDDVTAAVDGVATEVDTYLTSAQRIVTLAGTDPTTASAGYPQFLVAFTGLEEALPTVGDAGRWSARCSASGPSSPASPRETSAAPPG
jgi:methyl-accepting chemotaxis protein